MFSLNETVDQLDMASSVCWHGHMLRREDGHMLRREDGHIMRRALNYENECQRKKGRLKRTWKKHVEEESVKVGL